jgi:uncharacterized protein YoxC
LPQNSSWPVEQKLDGVDLKSLLNRVDGLDRKFDGLDRKFDGLDRKVDVLDRKVDDLTKKLRRIVGDVAREILRAQKE